MKRGPASKEKRHPCPLCSALFSNQPQLRRHKKIHLLDRPKFDCRECGDGKRSFGRRDDLLKHSRKHHGGSTSVPKTNFQRGKRKEEDAKSERLFEIPGTVKDGNLDRLRELVKAKEDLAIRTRDGSGPLHIAAQEGHIEIVKFLVEKGADSCQLDVAGMGPLYIAAQEGHVEIVKFLVEKGADSCQPNVLGRGPLRIAAKEGHVEIVKFLVEKGADSCQPDVLGRGPLHIAAQEGHIEIVKFLVEKGADIFQYSGHVDIPLAHAAESGHDRVVELLLHYGASPDKVACSERPPDCGARSGYTTDMLADALRGATFSGHLRIAKLLLCVWRASMGSTIGLPPKVLYGAAMSGNVELVDFLLGEGGDLEEKDWGVETPIFPAVRERKVPTIKLLLERGAKMDVRSWSGEDLFHFAGIFGNQEVSRLLRDEADRRKSLQEEE